MTHTQRSIRIFLLLRSCNWLLAVLAALPLIATGPKPAEDKLEITEIIPAISYPVNGRVRLLASQRAKKF